MYFSTGTGTPRTGVGENGDFADILGQRGSSRLDHLLLLPPRETRSFVSQMLLLTGTSATPHHPSNPVIFFHRTTCAPGRLH